MSFDDGAGTGIQQSHHRILEQCQETLLGLDIVPIGAAFRKQSFDLFISEVARLDHPEMTEPVIPQKIQPGRDDDLDPRIPGQHLDLRDILFGSRSGKLIEAIYEQNKIGMSMTSRNQMEESVFRSIILGFVKTSKNEILETVAGDNF